MASKNKINRNKQVKMQTSREAKTIRNIAIAVIVIVAIAFLWKFLQPGGKQYNSPPPMTIDPGTQYFATVKMEKGGQFIIQLFADKAPITVNSFIFLAREGFFNGHFSSRP